MQTCLITINVSSEQTLCLIIRLHLPDSIQPHNCAISTRTYVEHIASLSPLSNARVQQGHAMRVLDSKHPDDVAINTSAPPMSAYLTPSAKSRYYVFGVDKAGVTSEFDSAEHVTNGCPYVCMQVR